MRRDMVTRTVLGTKATVKLIDPATEAITTDEILISKAFAEDDKDGVKKAVTKAIKDSGLILLSVVEFAPMNKLFGLDTSKFMEMAIELDPETRKPLATETEEESEN